MHALSWVTSRLLRPLRHRRDGTVAILTAAAIVLVFLTMGAAVDFGKASEAQSKLQGAVDSAVLAGARLGTTDAAVRTEAERYLSTNDSVGTVVTSFDFDEDTGRVTLTAQRSVAMTFMAMIGVTSLNVKATAVADVSASDIELALVLDNSGSMAGTRITSLKTAAADLVDQVFDAVGSKPKVAIIPFAGLVNVGSSNSTASWIDTTGISTYHSQNFDKTVNRLSLFTSMNTAWGGCVEARPTPHDITDATPTSTDGATLFVPSFAVDEPGDSTPGYNDTYWNSYLNDNAGACTGSMSNMSDQTKQKRSCKYNGSTPRVEDRRGSISGPNALCDAVALTPLTATRATVDAAVTGMRAKGGTNIAEGLGWGWRVLSPTAPFTEGTTYTDPEVKKVLVLMTDGQNNWIGSSYSQNGSYYSAYGYSANNRLGTTSTSTSTLQGVIDDRMELLCQNVKATGIDVYTVTFDVDDSDTRALMLACASEPGQAYFPSSETGLEDAFNKIGRDIGDMRLSR